MIQKEQCLQDFFNQYAADFEKSNPQKYSFMGEKPGFKPPDTKLPPL